MIDLCIYCKNDIATVVLAKQVRAMSAELQLFSNVQNAAVQCTDILILLYYLVILHSLDYSNICAEHIFIF